MLTIGGFLFNMEGRAAYDEGKEICDCPYEPRSDEERFWSAGWKECAELNRHEVNNCRNWIR
jgi:hypothetical protein